MSPQKDLWTHPADVERPVPREPRRLMTDSQDR
jgi:hypothetical protein